MIIFDIDGRLYLANINIGQKNRSAALPPSPALHLYSCPTCPNVRLASVKEAYVHQDLWHGFDDTGVSEGNDEKQ